jgi:spermidine synthase
MVHNTTLHGAQFLKQEGPLLPLTYYRALTSAFTHLPVLRREPFALVGLGSGTVKCFARGKQQVDLFEIDPMVVRLAEDPMMFRYLSECEGTHEVFLGDGRIRLSQRPDGRYGAIILDAFSSDSIPSHLVTRVAIAMYFDKLAPDGVVLFNTTNRHIRLWPLLAAQAKAQGYVVYAKQFGESKEPLVFQSYWAVMARSTDDVAPLIGREEGWVKVEADPAHRPWTDDYVNILPYLKVLNGED